MSTICVGKKLKIKENLKAMNIFEFPKKTTEHIDYQSIAVLDLCTFHIMY